MNILAYAPPTQHIYKIKQINKLINKILLKHIMTGAHVCIQASKRQHTHMHTHKYTHTRTHVRIKQNQNNAATDGNCSQNKRLSIPIIDYTKSISKCPSRERSQCRHTTACPNPSHRPASAVHYDQTQCIYLFPLSWRLEQVVLTGK